MMAVSKSSHAAHPTGTPAPILAAFVVAFFMSVIVLFIDSREREQTIKDERLHVFERLSATRAKLEAAINIPVSITRAIAVVYAAHADLPGHEFAKLAAQAKISSPSIIDIALFRDTTISHIFPHEGNEKLIGLDFRHVTTQWPTYRNMMSTQHTVVAGPMKLVERDASLSVVVRMPVYRTDPASGIKQFIGAVGTPFLFAGLLREAELSNIEQEMRVAIRGRDGRGSSGDVFYGDLNVFAMNPIMQKVSLPGGEWEIAAYPRSGWGAASQTVYIIRLLGFVACLLAASWTYGFFRHLQLRAMNEQRLMESEAQLRLRDSALNASANPIVITDRDARIVWANPAFTKLTGYELEEAIGNRCGERVKSGLQDSQFYAQMWQTILSGQVWHGELVNQRKDKTLYHEEMTITPVCDQDGEISHFVALKQDISERKIIDEQMKNLAFYDPLTKLPNRRLLVDRLRQTLASSKRSGRYGALMFLDLDNFKPLNDTQGHDAGDLLLVEAAQRIANCLREEDTVARFGGDEFVVLLKDLDSCKKVSTAQLSCVAEKVRVALAAPYLLQTEGGKSAPGHSCTASIGVVLFVDHESGEEDILRWADIAMYQAKAAGGDTIRFFDPYAELQT
jgi:diguanylate cyclase (GGDEF)-like protein/PAS domain S-box-containing protein